MVLRITGGEILRMYGKIDDTKLMHQNKFQKVLVPPESPIFALYSHLPPEEAMRLGSTRGGQRRPLVTDQRW
jgi:hypothetical protein